MLTDKVTGKKACIIGMVMILGFASAAFTAKPKAVYAQASEETESNKAYGFVKAWADAFTSRDVSSILKLADDNTRQYLVDSDMMDDTQSGFGWSSPWPWFDDYRIVTITDNTANILYYARVSDPHITVWCETLTFAETNGEYMAVSDNIEFMDSISNADDFYRAYPHGAGIDYTAEGWDKALNDNALAAGGQYYIELFRPDTAAKFLLNIADDAEARVIKYSLNSAVVSITFADGSRASGNMVQPFGKDGIWLIQCE